MRARGSRVVLRPLALLMIAVALITQPGCANKQSVARSSFMEAFRAGDYEVARRDAAITARSTTGVRHDQAALVAGLSAHRLGDDADARLWLEPLATSSNKDIAGRANATLGLIARERRDFGLAAARFSDAATSLSGDDRARADLYAGEALERLGRPHAAQAHYAAASSHASDDNLSEALKIRLDNKAYVVQLGAFSDRSRADRLVRDVEAKARSLGVDAPRVVPTRTSSGAILYLVHVGRFVTRTEAESVLPRFGGQGIVSVASADDLLGPAVANSR